MFIKQANLIMIAFLLLSLSNFGFAQTPLLKLGFRGGLNMANTRENVDLEEPETLDLVGKEVTLNFEKKMLMAYGVGGVVEYRPSSVFAIQASLMYSMKGVKIVDENFQLEINMADISRDDVVKMNGKATETLKLAYLSLPVLSVVTLGKIGLARTYVSAGPEFNVLISAKSGYSIDIAGGGEKISVLDEYDVKDSGEPIEFGINFGAGVSILLGNTEVFFDGRYGLGLTKVNHDLGPLKSNVIYLNIGILFGTG